MLKKLKEWFNADDEDSLLSMYENEEEFNNAANQLDNFDEQYFERIKNGEASQEFLTLGGQQDCALIQSLLYSEGIPSHIENENFNRFWGGAPTAVTAIFSIRLFILSNDYDDAYKIVTEYCNSKKDQFKEYKEEESPILKSTTAVVSGLFFNPFPVNVKQKGMGITILPKIVTE